MSKPWSKLQKEFYLIRADGLNLQIQCRAYRMDSQMGSADIPRYWVTLGKETIWDYPKDFVSAKHADRRDIKDYPYVTDVPNISKLIREYIDTPKEEIFTKEFENDHWGLVDILRASDKRIGARRLEELKAKVDSVAAQKVIDARQNKR